MLAAGSVGPVAGGIGMDLVQVLTHELGHVLDPGYLYSPDIMSGLMTARGSSKLIRSINNV